MGKRILVATDFSDFSLRAVRSARELALALPAEITLIHVLAPGGARKSIAPGRHSKPPPERVLAADAEQGAALKQLRESELSDVPEVVLQLVSGESAAEAILDQAEHMKAGMIVLGTHGRTGLPHVLLGSVAEVVIRRAQCPVLVVPSR